MRASKLLHFAILAFATACVATLLACPTPAEARQPTQAEVVRISQEMSALEGAKDALGLDGVALEDLSVADVVPVCSFTKSGRISQYLSFYPLVYRGKYVGGFLGDNNGNYFYQTGLADLLQSYCDTYNPAKVAFVYNAKGLCMSDGLRTVLVSPYQTIQESHAQLSVKKPIKKQLARLELASTATTVPLKLAANTKSVPATVITMDYVNLVTQPNNSNICWAASLSMMWGCHGHTYYRAVDVAKYYLGANYNRPQSWGWIASTLRNSMGLGNYRYHSGYPSYNTILSYTQRGYPILGCMRYYRDATHLANNTEHALVIAGVMNNNSLIVNNPWPTGGRMIAKPFWNSTFGCWVYYYIDPESTPGNIAYAVLSGCIKLD